MIYVIRHGQTDWNKERRMQGRNGLPLNDEGMNQAFRLKEKLSNIKFDNVFSSPQERAVQTAEIASGRKVIIDERLDVFDLGEADGMLINDVQMDGVLPNKQIYSGVENTNDFVNRVFSFLHELDKKYRDTEVNILISGHRCTTGCIGAYFQGIPDDENILQFSSDKGDFKTYEFIPFK